MKNVLILTNNMNGGGAERVLLTILENLPRDQYCVDLALVYREGTLLKQLPDSLNVVALFEKRTAATSELIKKDNGELYHVLAKHKYDVEIAFLEGNAVKIMSKSTNTDAMKIAWVHIDLFKEHYTESIYESLNHERNAFLSFDKIFCVSTAARNGLGNLFGTEILSKSYVVFNPIDHVRIQRLADHAIIPKKGITFCAVGRLDEQKGFDRLLYATRCLLSEGFKFHIWLLGEGPLHCALREHCNALDISEYISFLGFQENPYPYISQADALISSSRAEGLPMVTGEALILRTPVIATNCSGQAEALQYGKYGLLVDNSHLGVYNGMKAFLSGAYTGSEIMYSGPERFLPYQLDQYFQRICKLV